MADMNMVMLSGTVPHFEDPAKRFTIFNAGDEKKVHGVMKLNVQGSQKDENGRYKNEIFEVTVWGKMVELLQKANVKGKGLWFQGRLTPSRKKTNVDGSESWTGLGFTANNFGYQRTSNEGADVNSAAPSAAPGIPAPAAPQVAYAPAAPSAPAAPAAATGTDEWPF